MKYTILLIFLATLSLQAYSFTCSDVEEAATEVMILRQGGVTLDEIKELTDKKWVLSIAKTAYTYPKYALQATQVLAVEDFAQYWFDLCNRFDQNRES